MLQHRFADLDAPVPDGGGDQAREGVQDFPPVDVVEPAALARREDLHLLVQILVGDPGPQDFLMDCLLQMGDFLLAVFRNDHGR